ncbi:regulatory phage cox family protein [Xenorhabdus bovienii]|uniref:regulatory phage cox family protein n=1 Tax=Xenorhabdus bovienii TaxID=40576 RepID=UPI002157AEDE|nr:regulatory phage cox family protein [Xenorhabdus bovienii]
MNEKLLQLLFKIPDPITVSEFCRRTGKSESSIRKLVDRRRLPIRTERQLNGEGFSDMRLMIMWNEWLEMLYEANEKIPSTERMGWKATWFKRINKLREDLGVIPDELQSVSEALNK